MHAQMLQKACARAKPEVHKTGVALQNYFRHFSTSNRLTTDDDNNNNNNNNTNTNAAGAPRPTPPNSSATQRSRAATREISNFLKGRGRSPSENAPSSSPLSPNASLSKPRVIDVRSLPRSLGSRGRTGTFRSRFGQDGQQGQQQQSGGNYTGQSSSSSSSSFGPGGSRFSRGPGGAKGGRGGRAGRGGRFDRNNSKRDGDGEAGDKKDSTENTTRREVNLEMDEEEVVFDRLMRFHSTTEYQPAFSLQSLVEYAPSFPSGEAGRTAIALEKLQEVGGEISTAGGEALKGVAGSAAAAAAAAAAVENDAQKQKQDQDQDQDKTTVEAAAAEGSSAGGGAEAKIPDLAVIKGVDDAVLEKIYEQAVQGKHEKMEFGTGPMATSRNLHLRTGTWNSGAMEKFEGKLKALVGGANGARGAKNSGKKAEAR
ncbi:hypothetical protein E4U09_002495 [Claviceps aff. purpurea]|uniref:Uncharacterized protein n=1 Tax=Claviceps aff. purpurea TaxID=1967640 RepID=A0A9P7QQ19_9HYPO|nr:hypothetical protein E4U09_002495 [Claviceps aff. purpurea]